MDGTIQQKLEKEFEKRLALASGMIVNQVFFLLEILFLVLHWPVLLDQQKPLI